MRGENNHNHCVQVLSTDTLLVPVRETWPSVRYRVDFIEGSWYELPGPRLACVPFLYLTPILRFR
jgi:hypothetical protein